MYAYLQELKPYLGGLLFSYIALRNTFLWYQAGCPWPRRCHKTAGFLAVATFLIVAPLVGSGPSPRVLLLVPGVFLLNYPLSVFFGAAAQEHELELRRAEQEDKRERLARKPPHSQL